MGYTSLSRVAVKFVEIRTQHCEHHEVVESTALIKSLAHDSLALHSCFFVAGYRSLIVGERGRKDSVHTQMMKPIPKQQDKRLASVSSPSVLRITDEPTVFATPMYPIYLGEPSVPYLLVVVF